MINAVTHLLQLLCQPLPSSLAPHRLSKTAANEDSWASLFSVKGLFFVCVQPQAE